VSSRVLRAVPSLTLGLAAMAVLAYALGRLTRSEWVLWLAPLTVALDGSVLLRSRPHDSVAMFSPLEDLLGADVQAPAYLISAIVTAGLATAGAYSGNRPALLIGAALALLGNALDEGVPTESPEQSDAAAHGPSTAVWFHPPSCDVASLTKE
jgi:hypothetical protein